MTMNYSLMQGTRVVTRYVFQDKNGKTHPVGSAGVVWDVQPGRVVVVCLDQERCEKCLVKGDVSDFGVRPALLAGTEIACMSVVAQIGQKRVPVAQGTHGIIRTHLAERNAYVVDIPNMCLRVTVPARRVQLPVAAFESIEPSLFATTSSLSHTASDLSAVSFVSEESDPVQNLRKVPTRSNLSPKHKAVMPNTAAPGRRVSFSDEKVCAQKMAVAMPSPMELSYQSAPLRLPEPMAFF